MMVGVECLFAVRYNRNSRLIKPADFTWKLTLPSNASLRREKNWINLVESFMVELSSIPEVLDIPVTRVLHLQKDIYNVSTAPSAAVTGEKLHAMGCDEFIICGGAGFH